MNVVGEVEMCFYIFMLWTTYMAVICSGCFHPCENCTSDNNTCSECVEGFYLGTAGNKTVICNECSESCKTCITEKECTNCADGYYDAIVKCASLSETIVMVILLIFVGVVISMILVYFLILFIQNRRRRTVQHREDTMPVSSNGEHDETEQVTRRESVEMGPLNENAETCEVSVGGSISYYPDEKLGHGSHGVVYKGRYGRCEKRTVAVKVINCSNDKDAKDTCTELQNTYKEIKAMEILAENIHIIQFFDSYINKNPVYLVFKLAMGTLVDFISKAPWQISLTSNDVVRGIVAGLKYTHSMNIVHRDLKPGNIFIIEDSVSGLKAVIGDFGQAKSMTGNTFTLTGNVGSFGYIAPEIWKAMSDTETISLGTKCNKASDIFSLGLVAYYAISLGKHPFGKELTGQVSISKGTLPTFHDIANLINSFAYEDMLKGMLNNNPDDRPTIQVVSEHPALWTSDTIVKYFGLKSDEFEAMIRAGPSNKTILEDPQLIPNGNWMNQLPVNMGTYLRSYKLSNRASPLYSGKEAEVRFLLRAIRNTNGHHQVYPQNTQLEMGDYPEGHVVLWLTVCPRLLMHVYNILGPL